MAKSELAKSVVEAMGSKSQTFGDLVLDGPLVVPLNQRPWSWKVKQINDLVDDIVDTARRCSEVQGGRFVPKAQTPPPMPHFFGPFVLEQSSGEREVVDGQQRLTASSIFVAMLRDFNDGFCHQATPEQARTAARNLRPKLYEWLQADSGTGTTSRLQLDTNVQAFFTAYVINATSAAERETYLAGDPMRSAEADPVKSSIIMACSEVERRLTQDLDAIDANRPPMLVVSRLSELFRVIRDGFGVVKITVKRPGFSPQLFRVLNARGLYLSQADKIKNELFIGASDSDYDDIKTAWDKVVEYAPGIELEPFLRNRFILDHGYVRNGDLYAWTKREDLKPGHALTAVQSWMEDAKLAGVIAGRIAHPSIDEHTRSYLRDIAVMDHTYVRPLLLAAARQYLASDPTSFRTLARLIRNIGFRELAVVGTSPERFLQRIAPICQDIVAAKPLASIIASLQTVSPDGAFQDRFAVYADRRAEVQYYVLYELELAAGNVGGQDGWVPAPHTVNPGHPRSNIEHVLPQTPSRHRLTEFTQWRDPDDPTKKDDELFRRYLHRIGNLLLLEEKLNGELSDYDVAAKCTGIYPSSAQRLRGENRDRRSYKSSRSLLAAQLVADNGSADWLPSSIEERGRKLATLALTVWTMEQNPRRAQKAAARKVAAKTTGAKTTAPTADAPAKKSPAKKAGAAKAAVPPARKAPAQKAPAKKSSTAKKAASQS